jgi:UDP-N-acetyl-2-amino-2-deoxyglucuronate dehydrogenase
MKKPSFAMIGAAGYIAPKHMDAIKAVGGDLVAVHDISDSVGILDSYFPDCRYYPEIDTFMRFLRKKHPDYFVICTPNYLHEYHCQLGLGVSGTVICEKPLSIDPRNIVMDGRIAAILQLRCVSELQLVRHRILSTGRSDYQATVLYHTPRGSWYDNSWKGSAAHSGGLIMNIGIHMLDMMCWLLGPWTSFEIHQYEERMICCSVKFVRGSCFFDFGIQKDVTARRELDVKDEFCGELRFTDLHRAAYREIIQGDGWNPEDVYDSIQLAYEIRKAIKNGALNVTRPTKIR